MGQRKRSDINRTANFTKGDEDQPTKKPRIPSGKENQPLVTASQMRGHSGRQLTDRPEHLADGEMSVRPTKNLVAGVKSRFRLKLERDSDTSHISQASTDSMLGLEHTGNFYEFQIYTGDSNDLGNLFSLETMKKKIANLA